jgi:hypothetical protein
MELSNLKSVLLGLLLCGVVVCSANAQPVQISSLVGRTIPGSIDGLSDDAQFSCPSGIAIAPDQAIYVADTQNSTIRKITSDGNVTTFAGLAGSIGSTDGVGTNAQFNLPQGIAVDSSGFIYVADTGNSTIRKITPAGEVTTVAGIAGYPNPFDGIGTTAQFNHPQALAVDSTGQLYIADTWNNTIRKIASDGTVTTLAGLAGYSGSVDGPTNRARFNYPAGITVDATGTIYVTEFLSHTIRQITPAGIVTTIAGNAGSWGDTDNTNTAARFFQPTGIVAAGLGNLFIVDSGNQLIRQLTFVGTNWTAATIAGSSGLAGNIDGTGSSARTYFPAAIAIDTTGLLYIADSGNNTIRISSFVPPRIHAISGGTGTNLVSWRSSAQNYSVETTTNVIDPTSWTLVTDPAVTISDRFVITNSPTATPAFYRLRAN